MNAGLGTRVAGGRRVAAVGALACMLVFGSLTSANASSAAGHGSATDLNPILSGPAQAVPANCPFPNGDLSLNFVSGSAVFYGTQNANGQWGGVNATGTGVFASNATPLYQGHLNFWAGDGNNAGGQTEFAFTIDFHGSGAFGSLTIHVNGEQTTNNNGTPTSSVKNVNITCS